MPAVAVNGADFVIDRSACVTTVVIVAGLEVLFVLTGSGMPFVATAAVLLSVPVAEGASVT